MSTTEPTKLFDPALLTTSAATYFTSPANTKTIIKQMLVHNTSSSPVLVTVNIVPAAGTASTTNQVFKKKVAALDTVLVFAAINATLNASDFISALAETGAAVSFHASGNEVY